MNKRREPRFAFWSFVAVLVLSPVPFGSNRPWSWSLLAVLLGGLLILWGVQQAIAKKPPAVPIRRIWPTATLFALVIGWIIVQTIPHVPASWQHPVWHSATRVIGDSLEGKVSLNPFATVTALMRLLSYAGVFWLSLQYGRSEDRARHVFFAVAVAGLGYAVYSLVLDFSGLDLILWYERWTISKDLTSTFVNRSNYAVYAGLGLLCATALLVEGFGQKSQHSPGMAAWMRDVIQTAMGRLWLLVLAIPVIASALLLSASRSGIVSSVFGLIVLVVFAQINRAQRTLTLWLVTVVAIGIVIGFVSLSGHEFLGRLRVIERDAVDRLTVYELAERAIADRPWLGSGYGTFEEVYFIYRDESLPDMRLSKAHNTYLENMVELGIPAALALNGAVLGVVILCVAGIRRRRRNAIYPCVGVAASAIVGSEAIISFSLQIPAVALTYAALMGVACAQSWPSSERLA